MRGVALWSVLDLSYRKTARWYLKSASNVVVSLSKIILFNTLPGTNSNIIPRWFLHSLRLPFFGIFIRCPSFHCSGASLLKEFVSISDVSTSAFIASGGMLSGPGALLVFTFFIAFLISVLEGLLVLMGSWWEVGRMSTSSVGGGLLRSSSKCSAHLFNWFSCLVRALPFLSVTGMSFFLLLPDNFLVFSYRSFMFFCATEISACLARFSTKFRLSILMLLFTSLLAMVYCFCASAFPALVRLLFRFSFLASKM